MFNIFKKKKGTGLLDDIRSETEKEFDYRHEEFATAEAVNWIEKIPVNFRKFPIFDQNGSGSCVGMATAKVLGIENYLEEKEFIALSPRDIYTRRQNKDSMGMWFSDALDIARHYGATIEPLMPSQKLNEADMNKSADRTISKEQVALIYKAKNYVQLPFDIDSIASIIAQGKGVLLGFRFNYDEWTDIPTIKSDNPQLHHAVAGVDFTLWQGEKAIIIDDSWGKFGMFAGQRIITKSFLDKRITFAGYLVELKNNWRDEGMEKIKPQWTFIQDLKFGMMNNNDVKMLQKALQYFEFFPANVEITGNYLSITAKAVYEWQKKYEVAGIQELNNLQGKVFGPKSISKMNELLL